MSECSPLSLIASYVPVILLYRSFNDLVKDPVTTLLYLTPWFTLSTILPLLTHKSLRQGLYLTTLAGPALYVLIVLMGAPFTSHVKETLLLSLTTTILSFPSLTKHGKKVTPEIICTLAGGYLGAIAIPLDWDREWQVWPVTVLTGVVVGSCVGVNLEWLQQHTKKYKGAKNE